jgi:hypothetical protein
MWYMQHNSWGMGTTCGQRSTLSLGRNGRQMDSVKICNHGGKTVVKARRRDHPMPVDEKDRALCTAAKAKHKSGSMHHKQMQLATIRLPCAKLHGSNTLSGTLRSQTPWRTNRSLPKSYCMQKHLHIAIRSSADFLHSWTSDPKPFPYALSECGRPRTC